MRSDPVRSDPVRSDPVRSDPVRSDPVRSDPVRFDPVRVDAARGRFLRGGGPAPAAGDVRPVVLASWERSVAAGVDLERLSAPFVGHGEQSPWTEAARSVLGGFARSSDVDLACSVGLVDAEGVVRARRDLDPALGELLDEVRWVPGYRHAESVVGTTAASVASREHTAALLEGPEHLHPALRCFREAAVPIGHAGRGGAGGRVALVVLAHAADAGASLLTVARLLAAQVDAHADHARHRRVIAVHDAVAAAEAGGAAWVLAAVDGDTWVSRAVRGLTAADQQSLHDVLTAGVLLEQTGRTRHLDLASGSCAEIRVDEVRLEGVTVGHVLAGDVAASHDGDAERADAEARRRQGSHVAPTARRDFAADLHRRPGESMRDAEARRQASRELFGPWASAVREVAANLGQHRPHALVGESGTGKRTLVVERFLRLHPRGTSTTVDCSALDEHPLRGTGRVPGLDRRPATHGEPHLLLLRHLQALTPVTARRLEEALVAAAATPGVVVVGCVDAASLDAGRPYGLVLHHFHETVRIPALRHRVDELADIVRSVLGAMSAGRSLRLSHQVIRVLEGYAWPGNINELEDVLRYVVARKPVGVIQAPDLPALCFTRRAPRLSMLETAQADAIIQALYEAGGNRYQAAALLGIARSTLYRKIDAFGISYIA